MSAMAAGEFSMGKVIRILSAALVAVTVAQAGDWERGNVDGSIGAAGATSSSLEFDKHGNAHVAYVGDAEDLLQYSFWDHNLKKWFTMK